MIRGSWFTSHGPMIQSVQMADRRGQTDEVMKSVDLECRKLSELEDQTPPNVCVMCLVRQQRMDNRRMSECLRAVRLLE